MKEFKDFEFCFEDGAGYNESFVYHSKIATLNETNAVPILFLDLRDYHFKNDSDTIKIQQSTALRSKYLPENKTILIKNVDLFNYLIVRYKESKRIVVNVLFDRVHILSYKIKYVLETSEIELIMHTAGGIKSHAFI